MKEQTTNGIQKSISDISVIRRVLDTKDSENIAENQVLTTLGTNGMVQGTMLLLSLIGIGTELASNHGGTQQFLDSAHNQNLQFVGLAQIALILAVLAGTLYFLVHRSAKQNNKNFESYVSRNFSYLKNLSFLSDLVVKFSILAVIIVSGSPQWVAPLCMLFVGDYLIQGRLFTISLNWSLGIGGLCLVAAAVMAFMGSSLLVWPFTAFAIASAISIFQLVALRKQA